MAEIDSIRALLGSKPRPVGWDERRKRLDEVGSIWPVADDVTLEAVDLDGLPGEFSIVPGSDPSRVLLFFHGGGYCSGSIVSHRRMVTEAGRAGGVRTLAIGFRLAPEHPFPAAYDDAFTAWRWLRNQGITANQIVVGGDSAGGGLTLALAMRLRDAGEQLPGCLWLASPWTDLTMSGATLVTKDAVDPLIHKGYLCELADAYVPAGMKPNRSAHFSIVRRPARASTHAHPGRLRGNVARRLGAFRRCSRRGRRGGHARNLARHDLRVAVVERKA